MTTPMRTAFPALRAAELRLAQAVAGYVPQLGLNRQSVEAGAVSLGLSAGERDLIAPHGARDIAAILWRQHDKALADQALIDALPGLKIREKIARLLNTRLDAAAADEKLARHLMGFFALPFNAPLYHRLLWQTSDTIWRLAGDTALDENHYSKRIIVSGIVTTTMMTRISQGEAAQRDQIDRNIEQIMAFEKAKAGWTFKPSQTALDIAGRLGRLRFGAGDTAA